MAETRGVAPSVQMSAERAWWLRTLAIFQSPRAVFAALRDDSESDAAARQEPVLALVLLAGIAGVLLAGSTGKLLDQDLVDNSLLVVAVLVFFTGGIYGAATYWLAGGLLHTGIRGAGGRGTYRTSRHILAFSAAPLVLTLLAVWPLRLAVYGRDLFRSGGADEGLGNWIFTGLIGAFALWSLALLALGISVVHRWTFLRGVVALALTSVLLVLLGAVVASLVVLGG
jgi:hypothetical protein